MRAIITFHSIDDSGSVLSYPPATFALLLRSLAEENIPVRNLDALLQNDTRQGVALNFDDGMKSVFKNALPIIKDYAIPAHLYLTTGVVSKDGQTLSRPDFAPAFDMLSWNEVEALHDAGVYIEGHTKSHPDLRALGTDEIAEECTIADDIIESRTGRRPQYFAYPFGYNDARARDYAREHYKASVTTRLATLTCNDDFAALPRLDSYYLQAPWIYQRLDTPLTHLYIKMRGLLRKIKGSE